MSDVPTIGFVSKAFGELACWLPTPRGDETDSTQLSMLVRATINSHSEVGIVGDVGEIILREKRYRIIPW